MKNCQNCANYIWGDFKTQIPKECIECEEVEAYPSNWKAKPQTNADRIRSMSDEELADFLSDDNRACPPKARNHKCSKYIDKCDGCWLEWLKQPAEVSDNG